MVLCEENMSKTNKTNQGNNTTKSRKTATGVQAGRKVSESFWPSNGPVESPPRAFDRPEGGRVSGYLVKGRSKVVWQLSTAQQDGRKLSHNFRLPWRASLWLQEGCSTVESPLRAFDRSTGRSKVQEELSTALKGKSRVWNMLQHGRKSIGSFRPHCCDPGSRVWSKQYETKNHQKAKSSTISVLDHQNHQNQTHQDANK